VAAVIVVQIAVQFAESGSEETVNHNAPVAIPVHLSNELN
jgi:hypothetical protein